MKLDNISENISNAFSWAFNNNGYEIDPTRIRIGDGSPVHSTGTTRLKSKWPYALTIAAPLLINYVSDDDWKPKDYIYTIGTIALLSGFRRVSNIDYRSRNMDKLCINTKPNKNTPPTSPKHMDFAQRSSVVEALLGGCWIFPAMTQASALAIVADQARVSYTFHKVTKGDWVIEDMPKPRKQEKEASDNIFSPIPEAV